jgi:hypothetical protein
MLLLEEGMPYQFYHHIRFENPKKTTKLLVSMIDFCRLKYYLIQITENQKQKFDNEWKEIYSSEIF